MKVSFKLTQNEFIQVSVLLLSRAISIGYIVFLSLSIFAFIFLPQSTNSKEDAFLGIPVPILILLALPVIFYFIYRSTYRANKQFSNYIEYIFNENFFEANGELSSSKLQWKAVVKVEGKKRWILIYIAKKIAHPIPKKYLSQDQINELKNILNNNSVKNNL